MKHSTSYDGDDWFLDDPLAVPGAEILLGRFIHFGVADRSQVSCVLAPGTWHDGREPNKQRSCSHELLEAYIAARGFPRRLHDYAVQ